MINVFGRSSQISIPDDYETGFTIDDRFFTNHLGHACVVCSRVSDRYCKRCQIFFYCGNEHQKNDWKIEHKDVCGRYLRNLPLDEKLRIKKAKGKLYAGFQSLPIQLQKSYELIVDKMELNVLQANEDNVRFLVSIIKFLNRYLWYTHQTFEFRMEMSLCRILLGENEFDSCDRKLKSMQFKFEDGNKKNCRIQTLVAMHHLYTNAHQEAMNVVKILDKELSIKFPSDHYRMGIVYLLKGQILENKNRSSDAMEYFARAVAVWRNYLFEIFEKVEDVIVNYYGYIDDKELNLMLDRVDTQNKLVLVMSDRCDAMTIYKYLRDKDQSENLVIFAALLSFLFRGCSIPETAIGTKSLLLERIEQLKTQIEQKLPDFEILKLKLNT
ncbi:hypothetical protein ACOME3_002434 [Neoechinorhynchus agilis]